MNQDKKDILKWLELSEENYTPEELKEDFSGTADAERTMKLVKSALAGKSLAKITLSKKADGQVDYKIEQE